MHTGSNLTTYECADACGAAGYAYAGVEASCACFCGRELPAGAPLPDGQCCSVCAGNASERCGDKFRLFAYPSGNPWSGPAPASCQEPEGATDPRNILNGTVMIRAGYLDQPYCVTLASGRYHSRHRTTPWQPTVYAGTEA